MMWPFRQRAEPVYRVEPQMPPAAPAQPLRITAEALARFRAKAPQPKSDVDTFRPPEPPPGVLPANASGMAQDEALSSIYGFASVGPYGEGLGFVGYPYLAELTQRPEYRKMSETIAEEMTRKWIRLEVTGDEDKSDRLKELEDALDKHKLRDVFRRAAELDGFYGMAHIYIDTGYSDDPVELLTELTTTDVKIGRGGLKAFRVVDPTWTYPTKYNSSQPLLPDFYKPQAWFVMGKEVHASRMLTIVSRPMPDLLKPAFNFGGLSLTYMAKPYVDNWTRTRESVSDLLHSFTVFLLSTDLSALIQGGAGGEQAAMRLQLFNDMRDNMGLMAINKATEEFGNVSAPLGGLDHLQAQAQEQMASVSSIPLVKLLGITPSGLNASSDGEVRVFYDHIEALQEKVFRDPLTKALKVLQISLWGEIDPGIGFRFEPLWSLDEAAKAAIRKTNADTAAEYIAAGVLMPEEERTRIAAEDASPYAGLDLSVIPEPPAPEADPEMLPDPAHGAEPRGEERDGE